MEYEELFESIVYKVTNQVRYVVIKKNDNGFWFLRYIVVYTRFFSYA